MQKYHQPDDLGFVAVLLDDIEDAGAHGEDASVPEIDDIGEERVT